MVRVGPRRFWRPPAFFLDFVAKFLHAPERAADLGVRVQAFISPSLIAHAVEADTFTAHFGPFARSSSSNSRWRRPIHGCAGGADSISLLSRAVASFLAEAIEFRS